MLEIQIRSVDNDIVYASSQGLRDEARLLRDDMRELQRLFTELAGDSPRSPRKASPTQQFTPSSKP